MTENTTEKDSSDSTPPEKTEKVEEMEKTARKIIAERKAAQQAATQVATPEPAEGQDGAQKKSGGASVSNTWARRILLVLLVFLAGAGAGLYFLPEISARLPMVGQWIGTDRSSDPELPALTAKITRLEQRLDQTEQALETLRERDAALEQRLDSLPRTAASESDPQILERLDKLEQARLQEDQAAEDKDSQTLAQSARLDMLFSRVSQLESSFVPLSRGLDDARQAAVERARLMETAAAQGAQFARIESRLSQVESYAARDVSGALLAFRIGALRHKATLGQPFAAEIEALKDLTEQGAFARNSRLNDAVGWLARQSGGVASPERLRDDFSDLIPALIRAATSRADDPWWKRAYAGLSGLVMVRKTTPDDAPESTSTLDNRIAAAERLLARRDLAAAERLLSDLPDPARQALDDWLRRAALTLRAEEEINRIERLAAAYYLAATPDADAPVEQDAPDTAPGEISDKPSDGTPSLAPDNIEGASR